MPADMSHSKINCDWKIMIENLFFFVRSRSAVIFEQFGEVFVGVSKHLNNA